MSIKLNKRDIELEINEKTVSFSVDLASHNTFTNAFSPSNKVQPSHNFLMTCVAEADKPFLREILDGHGGGQVAFQIAGVLNDAYTPEVNVTVKKRLPEPTPSTEAD